MAVAGQLTLLVYFELSVLVPLGSWNKQLGMERAFSPANILLGGMIAAVLVIVTLVLYMKSLRHGDKPLVGSLLKLR